jgi:hypothetical protein
MNKRRGQLLSRREFAQRAAMLSATASLVPAEMILHKDSAASAAPLPQDSPKLTSEGQAEADSHYQQILSLYGNRFDEEQRANIKRMCAELQPAVERIRGFQMQYGDAPALYLKPLVERAKNSNPGLKSPPSTSSKKP